MTDDALPPTYLPPRTGAFVNALNRMSSSAPWAEPAAIATCFAGAAAYVLISNPTDQGANDIPTCIVKLTTGLDCPGCGGTRAFYYLMRGNVPEAVRHHAIAVFAAPFLLWMYLAWALQRITRKRIPAPTIGTKTITVFLAVWGVFTVIRNLPFAPFTSLYV